MEIDSGLKRLIKKLKQLHIEGIEMSSFPEETLELFGDLVKFSDENYTPSHSGRDESKMDSLQ